MNILSAQGGVILHIGPAATKSNCHGPIPQPLLKELGRGGDLPDGSHSGRQREAKADIGRHARALAGICRLRQALAGFSRQWHAPAGSGKKVHGGAGWMNLHEGTPIPMWVVKNKIGKVKFRSVGSEIGKNGKVKLGL